MASVIRQPRNGEIIQSAYAEYLTNASITATIPIDDTIPQVSEGTEVLSVAITPTSATNKLRAKVDLVGTSNTASDALTVALFVNGAANALRTSFVSLVAPNNGYPVSLVEEYTPGSISTQTLTVRVGGLTGPVRLNGTASGRLFGGTSAATIVVEEIKA